MAPGEEGEPAEEQPQGTETLKDKKGLVPGGSKKHPKKGVRENGVAKDSGDLPTANGGDAVADKKKKKKKRKNRKRKGDEAEQVPAAKKTKGSLVQETQQKETQQKQDKAKKKRKQKQAPVQQE